LASNEARYSWVDEGFTQYSGSKVMEHLFPSGDDPRDMHQNAYAGYFALVADGGEDPLTTHADHFKTNDAFGTASYNKGEIYLHQLSYVVGQDVLDRSLLRYYNTWKFRHPTSSDFLRIVEKESGIVLDWYHEYFVNTISTIDYGIQSLEQVGNKTFITLERIGRMPMPVELVITTKKGDKFLHYMPLTMMHGRKAAEDKSVKVINQPAWPWTHPTYQLELDIPVSEIASIEIDPSYRMADIDRSNNLLLPDSQLKFMIKPSKKRK
jgi:aminopeptidase N